MPDLLLELHSEEIPARMQRQAADDLKRLVTNALVDAGVVYEGAQAFATPRRLALHIVGLPAAQPDRKEERKGPRVGAPDGAIQGFLKAAGLARIEDAKIVSDGKKGEFYVAVSEKKGRATPDLIAEILPGILRSFPWPKSMRWGAASARPDALRWVRPLRTILCAFGVHHETPDIVAFSLDGIAAGDVTYGHRFLAPEKIRVRRFEDYVDALHKAKVVLDADRRKQMILADAKELAFAQGLELVEDEGLLEEVAGLVEWPVVLMGEFERGIPGDSAGSDPRDHPRQPEMFCAARRRGQARQQVHPCLQPRSPVTAARRSRPATAASFARVCQMRVTSGTPTWRSAGLSRRGRKTARPETREAQALNIVFHEKLGTQGERIDRIAALAKALAPSVGCVPISPSAPPFSPRPTSSPKWLASSLSCRA